MPQKRVTLSRELNSIVTHTLNILGNWKKADSGKVGQKVLHSLGIVLDVTPAILFSMIFESAFTTHLT